MKGRQLVSGKTARHVRRDISGRARGADDPGVRSGDAEDVGREARLRQHVSAELHCRDVGL